MIVHDVPVSFIFPIFFLSFFPVLPVFLVPIFGLTIPVFLVPITVFSIFLQLSTLICFSCFL